MYSGKSISAPFSNLSSHKSTTEQQLLSLLPLLLKYYVWLFGKLAQFSRITPRKAALHKWEPVKPVDQVFIHWFTSTRRTKPAWKAWGCTDHFCNIFSFCGQEMWPVTFTTRRKWFRGKTSCQISKVKDYSVKKLLSRHTNTHTGLTALSWPLSGRQNSNNNQKTENYKHIN